MRFPLVCLLVVLTLGTARAAEPFFKKGDVIALVGGEDMVVASEYGYLELLLTRALPDYHLRFRNLAWEGDTVFEQRRDLNFPTWEEQLDKIGATVVIPQFGQMESLAGKEKLPEFIAAYETLIERFSGGGKRRVALLQPTLPDLSWSGRRQKAERMSGSIESPMPAFAEYIQAITSMGNRIGPAFGKYRFRFPGEKTRDRIHLSDEGTSFFATGTAARLVTGGDLNALPPVTYDGDEAPLLGLIRAKNRLWFDYWRPQNWAFLAGDRVNQPSSRDWRDPSIRWFPPEREQFLPLIEAKEKEIDALAAKLSKP